KLFGAMHHAARLGEIGHADTVAGGDKGVFNAWKIAGQSERSDLHAVEAEQSVDQYNRCAGRQGHGDTVRVNVKIVRTDDEESMITRDENRIKGTPMAVAKAESGKSRIGWIG